MKNPPFDLDQQQGSASKRRSGRRDGVSFEDVKRAAEKLKQEDLSVSLRSVRAELGTGSLSTIQRHLHALRMMSSPQPDAQSPLSAQVLRALATEFDRAATERTARINADLKDAQAS
ncbi:DNA-binding protein [Hydrogenophaga sp.]|uniref:DNA-binding protein n=1 Tax=Hydrogenophaga sp. TaxID=1904254 RepID=UPI003918F675